MLNTMKNYGADVSSISPSSEQKREFNMKEIELQKLTSQLFYTLNCKEPFFFHVNIFQLSFHDILT